MTPPANACPYQWRGYTQPWDFSKKSRCTEILPTTEVRSYLPVPYLAVPYVPVPYWGYPLGSPVGWQPPARARPVRASFSAQQEALLQTGFDLLKKKPGDSLQIARQLNKTVPHTITVYNLEARALVELGRYEESLAVLDRLSGDCKELPYLRIVRARALQGMSRLDEAEAELRGMYENSSRTPKHKKINGLALSRVLERMGGKKEREAWVILTEVRQCLAAGPDRACDDQEVELTLVRYLQKMGGRGNLHRALNIVTHLRQKKADNRPDTPCKDVKIEMGLARVLQDLGGHDLQKAYTIWFDLHKKTAASTDDTGRHNREIELGLAICLGKMPRPESKTEALTRLTSMRQRAAGNRVNTPCDDKEIELALAKVLQERGGSHNKEQVLTILTRLRQQAARGRPDTPCCDRTIELALGRYWQMQGGSENEHKALTILTALRQRTTGASADTPSHDRRIEIALGSALSQMAGPENLHKALAIFTRLRPLSGAKDQHTPCDNQDIELPIAICLKELHDWPAFDRWNRERPLFPGNHEIDLIQSIRYFKEFLAQSRCHKPRPELLKEALRHAQNAVDRSESFDPSSLSQLGHCYRALCCYPPALCQQNFGLKKSAAELKKCAQDCFEKAQQIDPKRADQSKDQLWRQWERDWLNDVNKQPCAASKEMAVKCCLQLTEPHSEQEPSL